MKRYQLYNIRKNFFQNVHKYSLTFWKDFDFSLFDCPLPWIVKPADSQSSIGVQRIDTMDELKPALEFALSKSPTHSAIVEEYFFGHEIVCEGFVNNGKYYLLAFADRKYFDLPDLLIPSQTVFPSTVLINLAAPVEVSTRQLVLPSFVPETHTTSLPLSAA